MSQLKPRLCFNAGLLCHGIPPFWICYDAADHVENIVKGKPMPQGHDIQEAFRNWKKRRKRREITRRLLSAFSWKQSETA